MLAICLIHPKDKCWKKYLNNRQSWKTLLNSKISKREELNAIIISLQSHSTITLLRPWFFIQERASLMELTPQMSATKQRETSTLLLAQPPVGFSQLARLLLLLPEVECTRLKATLASRHSCGKQSALSIIIAAVASDCFRMNKLLRNPKHQAKVRTLQLSEALVDWIWDHKKSTIDRSWNWIPTADQTSISLVQWSKTWSWVSDAPHRKQKGSMELLRSTSR